MEALRPIEAIRNAVKTSIAGSFWAKKKKVAPIAKPEEFSYCVGRPWPKHKTLDGFNPNNICVYAHGSQVQYGTMGDAEEFRKYVNQKTGEKNFIYRLVPV